MKYTVIAPFIQLHSGVLSLSKEQAETRMHNLRKVRGGYEIVRPVQFKAGEQIGYDGELSHEMASALDAKGKKKDEDKQDDFVQTSAQDGSDADPAAGEV